MAKKTRTSDNVYQLKITLLGIRPPIWRRIQIKECTLDTLHETIQTAMGWTNSHLHHFVTGDTYYGNREMLGEDLDYEDSTKTLLSDIFGRGAKRVRYEYDFGDSWDHEVLLEKVLVADEGKKYPVCLTGKRACPPEDVGGVWGYAELLEAINDPDHERHEDFMEWVKEDFDPEQFEPDAATRQMQRGLPHWRG